MDFRTTSSTNLPLSSAVDYRQIFCVSRGSSIPVLDAPELLEAKLSLDVRSSKLDYADIFGGFRDSDYAVSFEELIAKPEMGPTSPNDACTPPCARSPAEESSPNCSQDNTYGSDSSHEVPCQLPGEVKQFKMLYNQTNQGSNKGTTHMAQIHAVLGYACSSDERTPMQRAQCHSPVTSVESDACGSILCGDGTIEGKCSRLLPGDTSKQTSEGGVKIQKQNKSFSSDRLSDANDFGLGAHPPIVPPPSSLSSDTGTFSPPYFWEEVDINSVAAASAAAVKLAIEKAQTRIRLAKQLMEKNKEGLRTEKKMGVKVANRSKERQAQEMCKTVNAPIESSDWTENEKAGQVTPGCGDGKKPFTNNETVGEELKTAQTVHVLEEDKQRETTNHFITAKHNARTLDVNQEDHVHESKYSTNGYSHKEMRTGTANNSLEKHVDNGTKYKEGEVFKEWDDSQETLHTNEREHARTFASTQEIHDQKDEIKLEAEKKISAPHELDGYDEEQKDQSEPIGLFKKEEVQELEKESISSKEAMKRIENENKVEEAEDQEEYSDRSKSIHEMMAEVRRLEDIMGKEDNGKRLDESHGRGENEKESEEPCKWEENEKQQKDADSGQNTEMTGDQAHQQDMIGESLNKFDEGEENGKLEKSEEDEQVLNETFQMLDNDKRQENTCEWADTEEIWIEVDQGEAEKKTMDTAQEAVRCHENDPEAMDYPCKHDENDHLNEAKETCVQKEIDKVLGVASETMVYEEQGRIMEVSQSSFEPRGNEKVSVSVEEANDLDYSEMFDTNCMTDGALDLSEMIKQVKESNEAFLLNANGAKLRKKQNDPYAEGSETVLNIEKHFNELVHALSENDKNVNESEVSIIHDGNGNKLKTTHGKGPIPCIETEAAQQPGTSDRRDKTTEIAEGFESSQSTGKNKENHGNKLTTKEGEAKDSSQKEVNLEKEHIKKLDEKEKEKERIAVARAIREARGRAFVEARERAAMEKLTIEARGIPVSEARKRLGKASAEVNNQSSVDKDPKLRAERAAVERATSEARDRALEKSMYGNAASDGRNQAEKFPCGSRDGGMRQSFPFSNRESGPSSSCRSSDSSNHGGRSEGANNHRSKAEWERQQRTTERAAKALAEKNMRDLLAQKEQAERNRLAETLDADIKRWSSGKEGNLRELLSTLHFILGPVSGWQAVGLTDMIGSGAVKKTYRRATLFVHPDKLQQRGASIEDKYMCEKVFDLLKDAWDRFNREER